MYFTGFLTSLSRVVCHFPAHCHRQVETVQFIHILAPLWRRFLLFYFEIPQRKWPPFFRQTSRSTLRADFHAAGGACGTLRTLRPVLPPPRGSSNYSHPLWLLFPDLHRIHQDVVFCSAGKPAVHRVFSSSGISCSSSSLSLSLRRRELHTWSGIIPLLLRNIHHPEPSQLPGISPPPKNMSKMATLILEDGTRFRGRLFGANVSVSGEVGKCF